MSIDFLGSSKIYRTTSLPTDEDVWTMMGWFKFDDNDAVIMSMSSCSSTKTCCEKTIEEVYKHEGLRVN